MKFLIALLFPALVFATPSSQRELTGDHIKNGAGILALPTSTDTLVGRATTDTLTHKTYDAAGTGNVLSNIANANIAAGAAIDFSKLVSVTGDISIATNGTSAIATPVTIAKGGTNNGSLGVTAGGVLYTDGSKVMNVGVGTQDYVLKSNGTSPPSWASTLIRVPTKQSFLALNYQTFTITAGNTADAGSTWTNNGFTYTLVYPLLIGDTTVVASGTGAPSSSGTLTYASGTHTGGNLAFASVVATGTYRLSAGVSWIRVIATAGGASGNSSGTASRGLGGPGSDTTFGAHTASGGTTAGATDAQAPGLGGGCTIGAGAAGMSMKGNAGGSGSTSGAGHPGGGGGGSATFGGGGTFSGTAGGTGSTTTGGGGGGAWGNAAATLSGGGGGGGGTCNLIITSPASTYSFTVGDGGATSTAGTGGNAGGAGGSGRIEIEEY